MTKVVTFNGIAYDVSDAATFFVIVPEGETEAHVFINGRFVGKRSDFESGWLVGAMQSVEDGAKKREVVSFDVINKISVEVQGLSDKVLALSEAFNRQNDQFHQRVMASISKGARRCEHRFKL